MQPVKSGIKIIGYTDEFAGKIKVYDDRRKQIGEITKFCTKYTAKDMHLKVIATYEERYNETKDASGRKIGRGNMLVEILLKNGWLNIQKRTPKSEFFSASMREAI